MKQPKMEKKKMGRPEKMPVEDLKTVVRGFFVTCAGEDPSVMTAHNIYARLEQYAENSGLRSKDGRPLKASDFRKPAIKEFIREFAANVSNRDNTPPLGMPAFERLDIQHFLQQSMQKQKELLNERESYFESLYKRASLAIKQYSEMLESVSQLRNEATTLQADNKSLQEENQRISKECRELQRRNDEYRQYIRKYVDPERAERFLHEMQQHGLTPEKLIDLAERDIRKEIQMPQQVPKRDDKDRWTPINNLFKTDEYQ